jgi:hypothetical protein
MTKAEKDVLLEVVRELEDLRANLELHAAVLGHEKGISPYAAQDAMTGAKKIVAGRFDKLRSQIGAL